jgi:hypothetical protein
VKLSREEQAAVLLRARALLGQAEGWKNPSRPSHRHGPRRYSNERLTLGEACHRAAFELGLTSFAKSDTYSVAIATGLLRVVGRWSHKSLAGFNDDPETHKTQLLALVDRRLLDLL